MKTNMSLFLLCLIGMSAMVMGKEPVKSSFIEKAKPSFQIKGAKISTPEQAKKIASKAYTRKLLDMKRGISANDVMRVHTVVTLGYNLPGFAKKNDKLWEVRCMHFLNEELYAIMWVHSDSGEVYFLCGIWDEKPAMKN